jgi:hypothetical protein
MVKTLVRYFLVLSFFLPQYSQAGKIQSGGEAFKTAIEKVGAKSISFGFNKYGDSVYKVLDKSGNIVQIFHVPAATPDVLEATKPSKVIAMLDKMKSGAKTAGKITVSQLMRFPKETFTFFVALGAMAVRDTVFKYPDNPVAVEQYLTSQKDPIGQLGFAAFMVTNGLVSQPLMSMMMSRGWEKKGVGQRVLMKSVPYLGMSAGMVASHIVSEIGNFPGLQKCFLTRSAEACDEAHKAWVELNFKKKGLELVPSLVGLIGSAFIMGYLQYGLEKAVVSAVSMSSAVAVRIVGIQMLMTATPGGWLARGGQFLFWTYQVAQIVGFMDLSHYIEVPFRYYWNNRVVIGPELKSAYENINKYIKDGRLVNQKPAGVRLCDEVTSTFKIDCQADLPDEIARFSSVMKDWRDNIALEPIQSHNFWIQNLSNLAAGYNFSKKFYEQFISDVWERKFKTTVDKVDLLRTYPLLGVKRGEGDIELSDYLTLQDVLEEQQIGFVHEYTGKLIYHYAINGNGNWLRKLPQLDREAWAMIKTNLRSKDRNKIGEALVLINQIAGVNELGRSIHYDKTFVGHIKKIREQLGNPQPQLIPGQGYLKVLEMMYTLEGVQSPYSRPFGYGQNSTPEYLITQMIVGPDANKGDSVIKNKVLGYFNGFASAFIPPRVRIDGEHYSQLRFKQEQLNGPIPNLVFDYKPTIIQGQDRFTDRNFFYFLINEGIHPNILLNPSRDLHSEKIESYVSQWWDEKILPQYLEAWADYEARYLEIIKKLYEVLWQTGKSTSNTTPFSSGLIETIREESRFYHEILYKLVRTDAETAEQVRTFEDKMIQVWLPIKNIERLLMDIKLAPVNENGKTEDRLISRLSGEDLDREAAKFSEELKGLTEYLKNMIVGLPSSRDHKDLQLKTLGNTILAFKTAVDQMVTYGQIINSVSYRERYTTGKDKGSKCAELSGSVKSQAQLMKAMEECQKK